MTALKYIYTTPSGSVLFRNVLSPHVYGNIVKIFPRWVHPNIVTAMGFVSAFTAAALVMYNSPELKSEANDEIYLYVALGMVAYTVFDNTDGKQARRTGSSSFVGEVLDHGVDFTVVTASFIILCDSTGLLADYPYLAVVVFASIGLAQFMNNWYHAITGKMSWGGELISVDEALLVNIGIITYRWLSPELELFKTPLPFQVPVEYQGWVKTITESEDGSTVQLFPAFAAVVFVTAIADCWSKLVDSIQHATNEGTIHAAYRSLLPIVLYYLTFFFFVPEKKDLPAFILLSGAAFAAVGCRLIMTSTCNSTTLAWQQHTSMLMGFLVMFFQAEVTSVLIQMLGSILTEKTTPVFEQFGAGIVAWVSFGVFFVAGIREINFSKGGGSMFVIVPKRE